MSKNVQMDFTVTVTSILVLANTSNSTNASDASNITVEIDSSIDIADNTDKVKTLANISSKPLGA
jgi:hypothetical protein